VTGLLLLIPVIAATSGFDEHLSLEGELVVFSFGTADGKVLSLCVGEGEEYIVYRFGTQDEVELQYPADPGPDSWDHFHYSFYFRGGGPENEGMDLQYLGFENRDVTYTVYDEYYSPDETISVGVRVVADGKEVDIRGISGTRYGSLSDLRVYGFHWEEH
jgi:hypothetical protein